jgi:hypothetical protein
MKPHHLNALAGIVFLIATLVGCSRQGVGGGGPSRVLDHNPHRVVTISEATAGSSNPCEVDFPVTLLRVNKNHTIAWYASDHDYWIWFDNGNPVATGPNAAIKVTQGSKTIDYGVGAALPSGTNEMYFTYAIYDVDPGPNPSPSTPTCKSSSDERDTGVNVKR